MNLLDIIFPKKCVSCQKFGAYICASCFATLSFDVKLLCVVCNRPSFDGLTHPICRNRYTIDGVFASVVYGRVMKRALYQFKYQPYVTDLAEVMIALFYEGLIQQEAYTSILNAPAVLVPIPLHPTKFRKRGYNHAALLARGLGEKLHIPTNDFVLRVRETKPQYGLTREERKENIKDAFAIKTDIAKDQVIFLVDDLLTSGSTMHEAGKILKKNGFPQVYGLCLARDQWE